MALAPDMNSVQNAALEQATGMERRMNIRAFDYWEALLEDRDFPSVGDLDPEAIAPFREHSLLIDFTGGYEKPILRYVGSHLRAEASLANREIDPNEVPSGTLLSRLTNHYLEILANRAPIGFEAEYENDSDERVMYRGILLPLSDDGTTINFIYGVVSWKTEDILPGDDASGGFDDEVLDLDAPVDPDDEDLLELTQALDDAETEALLTSAEDVAAPEADEVDGGEAVGDAAEDEDLRSLVSEIDAVLGSGSSTDMPADAISADDKDGLEDLEDDIVELEMLDEASSNDDDLVVDEPLEHVAPAAEGDAPESDLGADEPLDLVDEPITFDEDQVLDEGEALDEDEALLLDDVAPVEADEEDTPVASEMPVAPEEKKQVSPGEEEFFALLDECRNSAADLARFDSRSRSALYDTLSLAYDFHLVSRRQEKAYQELLDQTNMKVQTRAPVTPIVKLVFGAGYDKTRLTEYASALSFADREGVPQGRFKSYVETFEGGIKAMVMAERAARNQAKGNARADKLEAAKTALRERSALMTLAPGSVKTPKKAGADDEFVLMVARRTSDGGLAILEAVETGKSTLDSALKKAAKARK